MEVRAIRDRRAEQSSDGGERDIGVSGAQVRRDGQLRRGAPGFGYRRSDVKYEDVSRPLDDDAPGALVDDARGKRADVGVERGHDDAAFEHGRVGSRDQAAIDDHADGNGGGDDHRGIRAFIEVVRCAGLRFSSDGCAFFAQALAFNAIFAVFPLAILIVAALGFIYGDAQGQAYAMSLFHSLAPNVQELLADNLRQAVAFRGVSGALALVALAWSAKNLFQSLAYSLNRAFDVPEGRAFIKDIAVALIMVPSLGVAFFFATAVPLAISFVVSTGGFREAVAWSQIIGYGTSVVLIFVIATALYVYLPNRRIDVRFGIPGALVFTAAWEIAQIAFAIYSTHVNYAHVYGALAAFALLLIWFYYMATIFLFGAEFSAQWAKRFP